MRLHHKINIAALFLFMVLFSPVFAQTLTEKIARSFGDLERDPALKNAIASLTVIDANTGKLVFAKNEQIGLAPASTLKVITSITAYSVLGANFTYKTDLLYSGEIDSKGILHGDVLLKGSGDPSLGSDRYPGTRAEELLTRWTVAIKAAGIRKIEGRVVADDQLFDGHQVPNGWTWVDIGNYYGAGVSSLNWRENTFRVVLKSGVKMGEAVKLIKREPEVSYLTVINEVTTGPIGSGDQVYAYSAPYSSIIYLRGTYGMDLNKKIILSLPDGALGLAHALKKKLAEHGVSSKEPATSYSLTHSGEVLSLTTHILDSYRSPKLHEIVEQFNKNSINLYGEALLKTLAIHEQQDSRTEEIVKWEQGYWTDKIGIPAGELKIKDGSGLSPESRVTTLAMAKILADAKAQSWFPYFYENLPVYNGIKMKSGTISGVLGYVGYQTASDGTPLVFSLLINNYQGAAPSMRQKMFKMLNSLK